MATKYHNRKKAESYRQLCLWETEEHQELSTGEALDAATWLFLWGKEHGYPGIEYQFGRKGYYLSHGVSEDSWIHIDEGYEHWEPSCILGEEWQAVIAVQAIQSGKTRPTESKPIKPIFGGWGWEKDVIARLSRYIRPNETHHVLHDMVRREALRKWAEERKYRELYYTSYEENSYLSRTIEIGKETWESFLERAGAFEVYCAYIATHTEEHIRFFLEEKL